jgi:hypothetical protein
MKNLKRILFGLATMSIISLVACDTNTMKGTTYVNDNAEHKPMVFMIETVGELEFVDGSKVNILFPYAIDTEAMESRIGISSELRILGEYERNGNAITIRFKLNEKQKDAGVLEVEIKEDGRTLLGEHGERFNKKGN